MFSLYKNSTARLSTTPLYGIILLVIFGISLALRVTLPYENVFTGDAVIFGGTDPWYHMRLVENLVQHFPHIIAFDPYTLYPYGQEVAWSPFVDLLIGSIIWVISWGSATQQTIETVGAYFPAILGALVTIPVYFIGREIFNRNVGLLSAALIAILPGQFLHRSLLGFTDHHIAEVLFSTTAALLLILALKSAKEKNISFSHVRRRDWKHLKKPLIYSLLTGLVLGLYLASWQGALLFISVIVAYLIIQYIIDHTMGKQNDYLCIIGVPIFLIALIMIIPLSSVPNYTTYIIPSLAIAVLIPPLLSSTSRFMTHRAMKRSYYPLVMVVTGIAVIALIFIIEPSVFNTVIDRLRLVFFPSEYGKTVAEVIPGLSTFGLLRMIDYFTTGIVLAPIALGLIIYTGIKKRRYESTKLFLVIWCLVILLAMLGQNRFAYYFAVNVALLSGYLCWKILEWSWLYFRETLPEHKEGKSKVTRDSKPEAQSAASRYNVLWRAVAAFQFLIYDPKRMAVRITQPGELTASEHGEALRIPFRSRFSVWQAMAGALAIVFLIAFVPNIGVTVISAGQLTSGPNEAWYSSLIWMQENTPDPFQNPDFYYELYEKPLPEESYNYPDSAYGIMNWWDYGHWITRIAHRIPSSNPFQAGAIQTAQFFATQNESHAKDILDDLDSKYVIIDYSMTHAIFYDIAVWAGKSDVKYWEEYYSDSVEIGQDIITLFYPEYYQSMCIRLYNFGGKEVVPQNSTHVISYEEEETRRNSWKAKLS